MVGSVSSGKLLVPAVTARFSNPRPDVPSSLAAAFVNVDRFSLRAAAILLKRPRAILASLRLGTAWPPVVAAVPIIGGAELDRYAVSISRQAELSLYTKSHETVVRPKTYVHLDCNPYDHQSSRLSGTITANDSKRTDQQDVS